MGRQRALDASRIDNEPVLDPATGPYGTLCAEAGPHKNQGGPRRSRDPKSVLAPARCLEFDWAARYLELRVHFGVNDDVLSVIMPAFDADHEPVPDTLLDAGTVTLWLREVLLWAGFSVQEVARFTSHSLKATLLTWAGKAGCEMKVRRALGVHAKQTDKTPILYAREHMAEPMRVLEELLQWVRDNDFDPDQGRLGRWLRLPSLVKNEGLRRLAAQVAELQALINNGHWRGLMEARARAGLSERTVRAEDADHGDEASCALSSSESEQSEAECPKAARAAATVAEVDAVARRTERWEGGLAPPPLYLFHNRRSKVLHFCDRDTLPLHAFLLCSRKQRGSYLRGAPGKPGDLCEGCSTISSNAYWQHSKAEFEQRVAQTLAMVSASAAGAGPAGEAAAVADDEREDWGPGRRLGEGSALCTLPAVPFAVEDFWSACDAGGRGGRVVSLS